MANADKTPRRIRREVLTRFEQGFDFNRLDYDRRTKPLRGKAIMYGVILASIIYLMGFSVGYYGWQHQSVDYEIFSKLVWILMIPTTVIGAFVWLVTSHRLEYGIRDDIRSYIAEREQSGGYLWRYTPLFDNLFPDDGTVQRMMEQSATEPQALDPEDYARTVVKLQKKLEQVQINSELAMQVYANITR